MDSYRLGVERKCMGLYEGPSPSNVGSLQPVSLVEKIWDKIRSEETSSEVISSEDPEPNTLLVGNALWWTSFQGPHPCSAKRFLLPQLKQLLVNGGVARRDEYKSAILRYKIGCELFTRIIDVNDWHDMIFNTCVVGGIENETMFYNGFTGTTGGTKNVLYSELTRAPTIPPEFCNHLSVWTTRLLKGELGTEYLQQKYMLMISTQEKKTVLTHTLLLIVNQLLRDRMTSRVRKRTNSLVTTTVDRSAGTLEARSPKAKKAADLQDLIRYDEPDIQEVLHYVYQHWGSEFGDIFPESVSIFNPIKNLCWLWVTQELDQISWALINAATKCTVAIAHRLGKTNIIQQLQDLVGSDRINNKIHWLNTVTRRPS
ncbi:hypothetical protein GNI_087330 [Gregarina niphandrodes]|uniref:Uncharacterized protein n=1 Tax=Gregarina niphandrodes TaxID=110365 RepID=A0A023B5T3_GRENI|nr:hypothetical protein GNI_087330 [Gregarina niphandrodes]EZG62964.1 hypothetical protein GNI_087330 [Gregarina niphandrodes]|eukprot:XP_011130702.1 hypothetical protein GNI_087330 [Gregarina niphandrodes]